MRSAIHTGLGVERFLDQHHRDVAHDRVEAPAARAAKTVLDDRLLVAELVAVAVGDLAPPLVRERHELDLFLADRAGEDFQKLRIYCHGAVV
jgi:hypothetical protein